MKDRKDIEQALTWPPSSGTGSLYSASQLKQDRHKGHRKSFLPPLALHPFHSRATGNLLPRNQSLTPYLCTKVVTVQQKGKTGSLS